MRDLVHLLKRNMKVFVYLGKKLEPFFIYCCTKLSCFQQYFLGLLSSLFHFLVFHVNPMWIHLSYYITLSLVGYLALKVSKLKTTLFRSSSLDLFFTSVSASTVSSMSTMEMEVFSNIQLVIMTILMLLGGEIFTSFLGLQLLRSKYFTKRENIETRVHVNASNVEKFVNQVELDLATLPQSQMKNPILTWKMVVGILSTALLVFELCDFLLYSGGPSYWFCFDSSVS